MAGPVVEFYDRMSVDDHHNMGFVSEEAMRFSVADFRNPGTATSGTFDAVISCENVIARCLNDDDLATALARYTAGGSTSLRYLPFEVWGNDGQGRRETCIDVQS